MVTAVIGAAARRAAHHRATLPCCLTELDVLLCCCMYVCGCRSVQKALELLADWRVANRTSHVDRSSRAFRFLVTRKQEKVLFKVCGG